MTRTDKLTGWEEFALLATGAASAFNVLLWSLGYGLSDALPAWSPLGVARVAFSVLSFVSMDLVVIVTVMAMRAGRRGVWSEVCSLAAAAAAAGIALEVAGVVGWPWLHAAPMAVLYTFMRHLAAPPSDQRRRALLARADQAETTVVQLRAEVEQRDDEIGSLRRRLEAALAQAETAAEQGETAAAQLGATLAQERARADRAEAALAQLRAEAERRQIEDGAVTIDLAGARYSLRDAADRLGMSPTTLARKLKREA